MKKLKKTLLNNYSYELNDFIIAKRITNNLKYLLVITIIFVITVILYIIGIEVVSAGVVFISFLLFFILPLQLINVLVNDTFIITDTYLISHDSSKKYYVIAYDKVYDVLLKDDTILLFKFDDKKYKIVFDKYDQDLKYLITVFEANGFLKFEGEYLERPIEIEVSNNKVTIIELDEIETPTQRLVGVLYDDYESVTPGFLNYILLRNSIISEASIVDENLHLKINNFDVKVDHPENISHEAVQAQECLIVFEDVESIKCFQKPSNERGAKNKLLYSNIEDIPRILYLAIISDSFVENDEQGKAFRLISSQGVLTNTLEIKYKEVIVCWNTLSGQSWFEEKV